jgi:hypothetical protein
MEKVLRTLEEREGHLTLAVGLAVPNKLRVAAVAAVAALPAAGTGARVIIMEVTVGMGFPALFLVRPRYMEVEVEAQMAAWEEQAEVVVFQSPEPQTPAEVAVLGIGADLILQLGSQEVLASWLFLTQQGLLQQRVGQSLQME